MKTAMLTAAALLAVLSVTGCAVASGEETQPAAEAAQAAADGTPREHFAARADDSTAAPAFPRFEPRARPHLATAPFAPEPGNDIGDIDVRTPGRFDVVTQPIPR